MYPLDLSWSRKIANILDNLDGPILVRILLNTVWSGVGSVKEKSQNHFAATFAAI